MAGSVNIVFSKIKIPLAPMQEITKVEISWVGDSSDGSVPETDFAAIDIKHVKGKYCSLGITDPGTTAPTDNYDIEILDEYGIDVFGGNLKDRDTADSEQALPTISGGLATRLCVGVWTFKLTNNSVNSATGKCILYFEF